jgi:hypothetical protein
VAENGTVAQPGFFWSEVQHNTGNTAVSNTNAGFPAIQGVTRLADNFTLTQPCTITSVAFYGYLTNAAATVSPFTGYTLQIWNGRPGDAGSSVVFGDTTTNRLASSVDTTYFRIFNSVAPPTAPGTTRKIWRNTLTVGTTLQPGTYWLDWASTVTGGANHFHPTKTIAGSRGAAGDNARQLNLSTGQWIDIVDGGIPVTPPDVPQDFPFDVNGAVAVFTVSGRVLTPNLVGLRNATISMTDSLGVVRTATTSSFGFFSFANVLPGGQYVFRVQSRSYRYSQQTVTVNGDLTLPDFVGSE